MMLGIGPHHLLLFYYAFVLCSLACADDVGVKGDIAVVHLNNQDRAQPILGDAIQARAHLTQLKRQLAQVRATADDAIAAANVMRMEFDRCNSNLEADEHAAQVVSNIVRQEKHHMKVAMAAVTKQEQLAQQNVARATDATSALKKAKMRVDETNTTLYDIVASTKHDLAMVDDLTQKRDQATKVAKKLAATSKDQKKVKQAYDIPKVLEKALARTQKGLPKKQQEVKDAAANYERAKQVEQMAQAMADKFRNAAQNGLQAAAQANAKVQHEQHAVVLAKQTAAEKNVKLMLKKKAVVHQEQKILKRQTPSSKVHSHLTKEMKNAKIADDKALDRVEYIARKLRSVDSDGSVDELLQKLESAKSKERMTKSHKMAVHLSLAKEKMHENLLESETAIKLKEAQDDVTNKVAATQAALVKTRVMAAQSSAKSASAEIKTFKAHLKDLEAQKDTAHSALVQSALRDQIEKVQGNIYAAQAQIQLAKASVESGRIEMEVKQDLAIAKRDGASAMNDQSQVRQAKRNIDNQLATLRLKLSGSKKPRPTLYKQVKLLTSKRNIEDAKMTIAKHKLTLSKMFRARAKLKKELLSVGYATRNWEFLEDAQHETKHASAAVALARAVAKERESKVGRLKESLGRLDNPLDKEHLKQVVHKAAIQQAAAKGTRTNARTQRKEKRVVERNTLQSDIKKALAEKEATAKEKIYDTEKEIKDYSLRLDTSRAKAKPMLDKSHKKVEVQANILKQLKAKYANLPPGNSSQHEKEKLDKEMAKASMARELAEEEQHVVSMNIRNYEKHLAQSQVSLQEAKKQYKSATQQRTLWMKKIETARKQAQTYVRASETARESKSVHEKAVEVLSKKLQKSDNAAKREKLKGLLEKEKVKMKAARLEAKRATQKRTDARNKEWNDMQSMKMKLARRKVRLLSEQVKTTKSSISTLAARLQTAHKAAKQLQIKAANEGINSLQHAVAKLNERDTLKESRDDSPQKSTTQKEMGESRRLAVAKREKVRDLEEQVASRRQALADQQKQLKFAINDLAKMKQISQAEMQQRSEANTKVQEAREKQDAARRKQDFARDKLEQINHPKGKGTLKKRINAATTEWESAKSEVKRVESEAAKVQLHEKQEKAQKDRLELKMKLLQEKQTASKHKIQSLQQELLGAKSKQQHAAIKVKLVEAKQALGEAGTEVHELAKSIAHLKVEGVTDHAERKAIEQSVETFATEKLVSEKQIQQIKKQLASADGVPAAQRLKLESDLARALDKEAVSDQKLADSKQKMQAADMRLQQRLAFRGIRWRKAKLHAAKRSDRNAAEAVHLLRVSTRTARENATLKKQTTSYKIAQKQKQLSSATAALDALRTVKGMQKSRDKLQLQIQTIKLDLKQLTQERNEFSKEKDEYDHRVKLAEQKEKLARQQLQYHEKQYRRARVLGEADDKMAEKLKDKIIFVGSMMNIAREEVKFGNQKKAIAEMQMRTLQQQDPEKRLHMKKRQWAMVQQVHDVKQKIRHMKNEAKLKEKLISCHTDQELSSKLMHEHISKARRLRKEIVHVKAKVLPMHVAINLSKDAKGALKNAAARLSQKDLALKLARQRGASQARLTQLTGELKLAEKDKKNSQLRAAAAAQAESPHYIKHLHKKAIVLKNELQSVLKEVSHAKKNVKAAQTCQNTQQMLIAKQQQAFLREKMSKIKSTNGNMFDQRHQNAAAEIHQLEKAAYQAQFREHDLQKKHQAYRGALGELMHKLTGVVGAMKKKTIKKLVIHLKKRTQSAKGALEVASQQRSDAEMSQLQEAVRIAKDLSQLRAGSHPPIKSYRKSADIKSKPGETFRKPVHQPSAVRTAVMNILSQPSS